MLTGPYHDPMTYAMEAISILIDAQELECKSSQRPSAIARTQGRGKVLEPVHEYSSRFSTMANRWQHLENPWPSLARCSG